jgi:hypothetical protein
VRHNARVAGNKVVPPFVIQPKEQDLLTPGTSLREDERPGNASFGFGPTLYDESGNIGYEPRGDKRTDFPLDNGQRLPFKNLRGKR